MLAELSIKNFAIIESITLSFEKGLTVLTGETGAGKSIIIDAIGLLVGGRGSSEFVRFGTQKAEIEGLFLLETASHPSVKKCEEYGIDPADEMIVLRRTISENGKSVCRINGKLVTISILREIGQTLIDIHGQHEHLDLMNRDTHITLLDHFESKNITREMKEYKEAYLRFMEIKKKLQDLSENEQQMAHRLDLLKFQLEEIKEAKLKPNEDAILTDQRRQLSNYEKIHHMLQESYETLVGEQKGLDRVRIAMHGLESIASFNEKLKKLYDTVANSYYMLEEASFQLSNELEGLEFDPELLDHIELRLNEISLLKKKYGPSIDEIIQYGENIEQEIDTIINREKHISQFEKELQTATMEAIRKANQLSESRKIIAETLTKEIHAELKELYMEKTKFEIRFDISEGTDGDPIREGTNVKLLSNGIDQIEFLLSTNPGEPLKELSKVASGGELSRIMLALKSIFSEHQGITSIIFDEVDTGVSGRVAQAIAEKIHKVSIGSQVLCITHLPQVASMADTHLYIAKEVNSDRTKTSVHVLVGEERVKEVARMISGVEITEVTKKHASELLEMANTMKQNRVTKVKFN